MEPPVLIPDCTSDPLTEGQQNAIREELDRTLASAPFRQSKRYSGFLRYIVEQTLAGRSGHLKERCIGAAVFDRGPDYDTSVDHVVRSAAGEVRRRLAQYHLEMAEGSGVRIELRPGSYVPQFRFAAGKAPTSPQPVPGARWNARGSAIFATLLACVAAAGGVAGLSLSREDGFLDVVTRDDNKVLLCVSDRDGTVGARDAFAVAQLAAAIRKGGSELAFMTQSALAGRVDEGSVPTVMIGGSGVGWPAEFSHGVRYRLEGGAIIDGNAPAGQRWSSRTDGGRVTDFALVTRIRLRETGKMVVMVAGLTEYGTEAAARFLTTREAGALKGDNVQVILSTEVSQGAAGTTQVVAKHSW